MRRVKQFFRCITAKLTEEDKKIINEYLNENEINLLYKLPVYDIKHCVSVAMDIKTNESEDKLIKNNINYKELIRIALLHDIGKSYKILNPFDKSILVLSNKFTKGRIKKYENKSRKIYIYFNHGKEGYKILKGNEYSEEFLKVIRDHHDYSKNNKWLEIIRKYDDMNWQAKFEL